MNADAIALAVFVAILVAMVIVEKVTRP